MCSIQSLGQFDHTRGGHLYLEQLKVVLEFPAGGTILLPSSAISHANIPVAEHEARQSIIQYSAGGLQRWETYGFRSWRDLEGADPCTAAEIKAGGAVRWAAGLDLFSTTSSLSCDRA